MICIEIRDICEKNIKDTKIKEVVNDLILKAKNSNLIKPVNEAFKDIPVSEEIHKGNKEYFCD